MNKDEAGGNWKQFKGKVKEQWGKLTDDDMTIIEGKRDQLVGKIQERYGYQKDQAEKEVVDWETRNEYRWYVYKDVRPLNAVSFSPAQSDHAGTVQDDDTLPLLHMPHRAHVLQSHYAAGQTPFLPPAYA